MFEKEIVHCIVREQFFSFFLLTARGFSFSGPKNLKVVLLMMGLGAPLIGEIPFHHFTTKFQARQGSMYLLIL